jgi:hypothetical protein
MNKSFSLIWLTGLIGLLWGCNSDSQDHWAMQKAPIMTVWADDINPEAPWDYYPRPYLKRDNWINLNGLWDYTVLDLESDRPETFSGKILVPFPIESALSGVMERVDMNDVIWYKRFFTAPKFDSKQRIIIHFEAVDWHSRIWVDDHFVGEHKGGYSPFEFDITDYVKSEKESELYLSVWDPTTEGPQPVGKQNSNPHGIWYTPTSGIWQTAWLETVSKSYITDYDVKTDIDRAEIWVNTEVMNPQEGDQIELVVKLRGDRLVSASSSLENPIKLEIPNMELWSPDNPVLYDLDITLSRKDKVLDQVKGYFGMRKISLGKDSQGVTRIFLNNEFVFQNGPLDQGFWPDGLYTPPTEEAMIYDLKILKEMGFNMLRKHVKVENRRFYYWTDKMGLLVWQDMPNGYFGLDLNELALDTVYKKQFETELSELILTLDNHPSIVMWVPFNEGWGQYDTERIVEFIRELDPSRLINNVSGWVDKGVGDVHDIHHYPEPVAPPLEDERAIVLGEFGGLGLPVPNHTWQQDQNWGYENMEGPLSLLSKYETFYNEVNRLVIENGLSAVVYTQTTDVEIETNGLMTYDRKVDKMGKDNLNKAHSGFTPPFILNPIREFITDYSVKLSCFKKGAQIHYTTDGSEPIRSSKLYTKPFTINSSTHIKAMAFWKNGEKSRVNEFEIKQMEPQLSTKANARAGLAFNLYDEAWEKLPDFSNYTPVKQGFSERIDLSPAGNRTQDFGLVFTGYIRIPETGVYRFFVSSDDGGRLIINQNTVVDYDGIHGLGEKGVTLALEKGFHPIEFQYFQHLGGYGLRVFWQSSSIEKEEIGSKNYFH